jgi:subtilase family serine protease
MRILRTLSELRLLVYAAALLLLAKVNFAQQALQTLHNQIPPEVSSGRATFVESLPSDHQLYFSIVLPLRNEPALQSLLQRLYDPSSPDYHKFLTVDQFTEQFGPTVEDYDTVVNFAKTNGFTVAGDPPNRMAVPVSATAAQFESAFHVRMNLYQHPTENRLYLSPDRDPSLNLSVPIKGISGLSNFSVPHPVSFKGNKNAFVTGSGGGGTSYLPSDMRAAYYGSGPLTGSGQCVGLVEFDGYYINDVLATLVGSGPATASAISNGPDYVLTYNPPGGGGPFTINITNESVNGAISGLCDNITGSVGPCSDDGEPEVVLDIAEAIGMAPGINQVHVYIAAPGSEPQDQQDTTTTDDYLMLNQMATDIGNGNGCYQLSNSWAWWPSNPLSDPDEQVFEEFQAQGQSFFSASGDSGAWQYIDPENGPQCSFGSCYTYPPESPNVTAVGGTVVVTNGARGSWQSEDGWGYLGYTPGPSSGGGVSVDNFPIPNYQTASGWASECSDTYYCSTQYRNAPDVGMNADNFWLCAEEFGGHQTTCEEGLTGTSFAAPLWAGFTALMNQQAVAEGASMLGFINPLIYSIGEGANYLNDFNDLTDPSGNTSNGYAMVSGGYNFITGWGSPNGQAFINAVVAMPDDAPTFSVSIGSSTHVPEKQGSQPNVLSIGHVMTYPVTVTPNAYFAGTVVLSASGLPQGVTASFSPQSLTFTLGSSEETSTMTLTSSYNNPETTITNGPVTFAVTGTVLGVTSSATDQLTTQGLQYKGDCGVANPL